jgi:DNA-binding XRE family transcriptional regulator
MARQFASIGKGTLTSAQIRAARALLGWSQTKLAKAADLSRPTVDRAERESVSDDALAAMREALENAGVIFVEENGDGPGVRLRKGKRR